MPAQVICDCIALSHTNCQWVGRISRQEPSAVTLSRMLLIITSPTAPPTAPSGEAVDTESRKARPAPPPAERRRGRQRDARGGQPERVPAERYGARQQRHHWQADDRHGRVRERHGQLLPQQPGPRNRRGQQIPQRRPAGLAGHGVPAEQGDRYHEQETRGNEDAERCEVEPTLGGHGDQPRGAVTRRRRAAHLEGTHQDPGKHQQQPECDHRPAPPELPDELHGKWQSAARAVAGGAHVRVRRHQDPSFNAAGSGPPDSGPPDSGPPGSAMRARNASSRRRLGATRSTGTPAPTSAATTADTATPLGWTMIPSWCGSADSMPPRSRSTVTARAASVVPTTSAAPSPMISRTVPAATRRPRCITTTWLQVCSTSPSMWLERITVLPLAA